MPLAPSEMIPWGRFIRADVAGPPATADSVIESIDCVAFYEPTSRASTYNVPVPKVSTVNASRPETHTGNAPFPVYPATPGVPATRITVPFASSCLTQWLYSSAIWGGGQWGGGEVESVEGSFGVSTSALRSSLLRHQCKSRQDKTNGILMLDRHPRNRQPIRSQLP